MLSIPLWFQAKRFQDLIESLYTSRLINFEMITKKVHHGDDWLDFNFIYF